MESEAAAVAPVEEREPMEVEAAKEEAAGEWRIMQQEARIPTVSARGPGSN